MSIKENSTSAGRRTAAALLVAGITAVCSAVAPVHAQTRSDAGVPQHLQVPPLAYDEQSVVLVWENPSAPAADIKDYVVYMNGLPLGTVRENLDHHSPAKAYIDHFYQQLDQEGWHQPIQLHNFTATGLQPDTEYQFTVRALYADGRESGDSPVVVQKTTAVPQVLDITAFGAIGDGRTLNTAAIQRAIDECTVQRYPQGCKVRVPAGTFITGALFLHSFMTLEVAGGAILKGSDNSADYPLDRGYFLYPYTDPALPKRPPSLINALTRDDKGSSHAGTFENIRIVGSGTLDGNGWTRGISAGTEASIKDELGRDLPQYRASNATKVSADGILAKSQTDAARQEGISADDAYKNRRSSLMTLRGVRNLYLQGLTIVNPAYHGVMALESQNVTLNALVHTTFDANNGDGIEFGNSQQVMVFNNFFDTGDDCVNFAAGYGAEVATFQQPAQSGAWIFNNYFRKGHGAVVTGSHTGAWIEKIVAEDNVMNLTDVGLRMKSRPYYGGGARDVVFRANAMRQIANEPFVFTIKYKSDVNDTRPAAEPAQFRDVSVSNVSVDGAGKKNSILVDGMTVSEMAGAYGFSFSRDAFHQGLHFTQVKFRNSLATDISFLKQSSFDHVSFENRSEGAWNFSHISQVQLQDSLNGNRNLSTEGDTALRLDAASH